MPHKGNLYALRLMGSLEAVRAGLARPAVLRRAWSCLLVNASELLERTEGAVLFRVRGDLKYRSRHLRVDTFLAPDQTHRRASMMKRLATSVQRFRVRSEAGTPTPTDKDRKSSR